MNILLIEFVKSRRKALYLTQEDLAKKAGVGLRFVRDLQHGKINLRIINTSINIPKRNLNKT